MGKEPAWNASDADSLPGSGKSSGGGHGSPLQYSYLENSTDRGAWQVKELDIPEATEHSTQLANGERRGVCDRLPHLPLGNGEGPQG